MFPDALSLDRCHAKTMAFSFMKGVALEGVMAMDIPITTQTMKDFLDLYQE